jgi:hypothetical protein
VRDVRQTKPDGRARSPVREGGEVHMDRSDLSKRFDELYGVLSHDMALETRRAKVAQLMGSPDAGGPRTG